VTDALAGLVYKVLDDVLTIDIVVSPRSARPRLGPVQDGRLKVAVSAPPVDGEANQAVIDVLRKSFGVARSAVTIIRGETGRRKTVAISGGTLAALARAVAD
jgi:uncharacterized protein